jgi:hypothetical protein
VVDKGEAAGRSEKPSSAERTVSDAPVSAEPAEKPQLAEHPERQERPRTSKRPSAEPPLSTLRMNLQRELVDNSLPFFVASQPAARPFPRGALSFAALIFFGVGAAVAIGAVSALRASRSDVVVHERSIIEPAPSAADLPRMLPAPPAAPQPALAPAPPAPVTARAPALPAPSPAAPSKAPEARSEPAHKAPPPRRVVSKPRPRPLPVRSTNPVEPPKDGTDPSKQELETLPFTAQPY